MKSLEEVLARMEYGWMYDEPIGATVAGK